jgi:hypothetical protein
VHRTVRCTPDTVRCPISFLKWHSRPLAAREPLAHRTVRCPLLAVGSATCPAQIARPTVGSPDSPVNYSRTSPVNSRERPVRPSQSGAPDTVWCTTGQSGAPRLSSLWLLEPSLLQLDFFCFRHLDTIH